MRKTLLAFDSKQEAEQARANALQENKGG